MNKKTVLCLSGGLDSCTLLYWLIHEGYEVYALGVNYGQRHYIELERSRLIARKAMVEYRHADLSNIQGLLAGSSQTSKDIVVPEGHYADESMKVTVVPNRNALLLNLSIAWAISKGADSVSYASHAGDHAVYPDCRPEFIEAMRKVSHLCHYNPIELLAPFSHKTKADIAKLAHELEVPVELTWSCYKGYDGYDKNPEQCGRCSTCFERRQAFFYSGLEDPTLYLDKTPIDLLEKEFAIS